MKRNIFKTILLSACILQGGSALAQQEKAEPGKFSRLLGTLGSAMPTRSRRLVRS